MTRRSRRLAVDSRGHRVALRPTIARSRQTGWEPIELVRVRPVDQPLLVADASKLRAATGWEPRFSIESTLADMLDDWRRAVSA